MKKMTNQEAYGFLTSGTRTGKLATVREDGRPHIAPIWFVLDGEDLIFTTWHESVKAKNLQRDSRASICVDEEVAPFSFVIVEGEVELSHAAQDRLEWATQIAGRYMGDELAKVYGERNSVDGVILVRLKPSKIIAKADVAGW